MCQYSGTESSEFSLLVLSYSVLCCGEQDKNATQINILPQKLPRSTPACPQLVQSLDRDPAYDSSHPVSVLRTRKLAMHRCCAIATSLMYIYALRTLYTVQDVEYPDLCDMICDICAICDRAPVLLCVPCLASEHND